LITSLALFSPVSNCLWAQNEERFIHPGIFNTQQELDQIKRKIATDPAHPRSLYYKQMKQWEGSSHAYRHQPIQVVRVKAGGVVAEELRFRRDAQAAYACALQWVITDDERYMRKSRQILNDWAKVFVRMETVGGQYTADQLVVEAGWVTPIWVAAAEIIRHYNGGSAGWKESEISQFCSFLDRLWEEFGKLYYGKLPERKVQYRCNWGTSAALSMICVAVFQGDLKRYKDGIAYWKEIMPLNVEESGEIFETCRDCYHPGYALSTLVQGAEIAHHQGDDLYGIIIANQPKPRLWYGLEYRARRVMGLQNPEPTCYGGYQNYQASCNSCQQCWHEIGWEIGMNHFRNRMNLECSHTTELVVQARQREFYFDEHFVAFGTLTHGLR
jgi:hypothetical protein